MDAAARLKHVKRLKPALAHRDRSIPTEVLIVLNSPDPKNPSFCEDVGCFFVQCGKQTKDGHELVSSCFHDLKFRSIRTLLVYHPTHHPCNEGMLCRRWTLLATCLQLQSL